jgi:hypothetical protein
VTTVAQVGPASYAVAGWNAPDIAGAVTELSSRGVRFNLQAPDANVLSIPQLP